MDTYGLYAVKIGSNTIDQITDQRIAPGIEEMLISGDGSHYTQFVSKKQQNPVLRFTTTALKKALDLAGTDPLLIDEAGSSNALVMYFRKRAMAAEYAEGASHMSLTVNLGALVPVSLRGTHPDEVSVEYLVQAVYDGTNDPVVPESGQSVPDLSPDVTQVWTVGPWDINGTRYYGLQDFTFDFGWVVEAKSSDGDLFPTTAILTSQQPVLRCTSLNLGLLAPSILGVGGVAISSTTRAWLRKKTKGAALVPEATAEHIEFAVAEGRINPDDSGGPLRGDTTTGVYISPSQDGANAVVAIDTAKAMS